MNRLLVALLAAFDALLAAAGGIAVALAPLTLLWVFALGGGADAASLWPATAVVWQLGHLVPVSLQLPDTYVAAAGIDPGAAQFVLSLAPLGFAAFTAIFAARSAVRAARAGEPLTGAASGTAVFAVIAAAVALTGTTSLATVETWQAILFPAAIYAVPAIVAAVIGAWSLERGIVADLRRRVEAVGAGWGEVPGLVVRGTGVALAGLLAVGALVVAVAVFARGAQVVALFQAGNVDLVGFVVLALGQLAYLPTLVVWGLSFAAGPGFALGADTAVSPSGTQLGVVPGVPVLGAIPDSTTGWLLLLVLLPVAVGALTGWVVRSRFAAWHPQHEPVGPRVASLAGIAVLTGAVAALLAVAARGSIGPGRLADVGPQPGPLAAAVGLEVLVGAAILLLSPRRGARDDADRDRRASVDERERAAFVDHAGQPVPFADAHPITAPGPAVPASLASLSTTATLAPLPALPPNAFGGTAASAEGDGAERADAAADPDETGPMPFLDDDPASGSRD
ncbi:DUF6350 family protein [Microbacterium sp. NPDC091313]